eukprot:GEMP01031522.1.p1 GENE.GEMP01031522.1~~GEMP01031522.1.p1  ORF type:complete len:570 (+),score=99.41 GEMP01031522.1:56-1765(+)
MVKSLYVHVAAASALVNHDCRQVPNSIVDWDALRQSYQFECPSSPYSESLMCAAKVVNWRSATLSVVDIDFAQTSWFQSRAEQECPLGLLAIYVVMLLECLERQYVPCYEMYSNIILQQLRDTPFLHLQGTEWPIFALMATPRWDWPGDYSIRDFDCGEVGNAGALGIRWSDFLDIFYTSGVIWRGETTRFIFNTNLSDQMGRASKECLYGVYTATLIKSIWTLDTESSGWSIFEPYIMMMWDESPHLIGSSKWPIMELLHQMTFLKRHSFQLDFSDDELFGISAIFPVSYLTSLPTGEHFHRLAIFSRWRPHFAKIVHVFRTLLRMPTRFAYITMVYGEFNKYIKYWLRRVQKLDIHNLVMLCLDDEAYAECTNAQIENVCIPGEISPLNKYSVVLIGLQLGFDIMWLDFDVFLLKNPTDRIYALAEERKVDFLIGYGFQSDCICNGFFFIKATDTNVEWVKALFRWLYTHPYEHDQRAMSAFLNYTEKVIPRNEDETPTVPPWYVFDVENHFINWPDWTGELDDIKIVMEARHDEVKEKEVCGILPNIKTSFHGLGWIALEQMEAKA